MTTSSTDPRQLRPRTGAVAGRAGAIPLQRQPVRAPAAPARPDGLAQLTALVRDGFAGLPTTLRSPRRTALWGLWLLGIIGDSATTLAMVSSGSFEEGNPAASVGMGFLGLSGYIVVATLVCLVMATISTGRPTGPVARVAVGFLLLVGLGKVTMAVSNLTLWATMR
jgi:hypothetical protein